MIIFLAGLILPVIMMFFVCDVSTSRHIKQNLEIHRLKSIKDSTIKSRYIQIRSLENEIANLDYALDIYVHKLDSLDKNKRKVKIVYKTIYKQIDNYSDTTLLKYWKNEFNYE
tara:strand:- start:1445 stop:1783 length:339 start_codon:yes stop_codon:yes gene_type:complete